jgi:hypothetical protein
MLNANFIRETLALPASLIAYHVSQHLAAQCAGQGIVMTQNYRFNLYSYAKAQQCHIAPHPTIHSPQLADWDSTASAIEYYFTTALLDVAWQGHHLNVLSISWTVDDYDGESCHWIIAATQELAEAFFEAVCTWENQVHGEVLVFENETWHKSEELYQSIQDTTFEKLVLKGNLKHDIFEDLARFFAARATYQRYRLPWKRGILLIGPPGNGKTHTVKALINRLQQPCLYIKSFGHRGNDQHCIHTVFERARQTAPCLLVLEDLDSLVTEWNRSYFLNELDGFAANEGIATIATANDPGKLDPAILDRPSRFDRKYHFDLPGTEERYHYIAIWNQQIEQEMHLSDYAMGQIAEATHGFSFAYLKELFLSSMMEWIATPHTGARSMEQVMHEQVGTLRHTMESKVPLGFANKKAA